MGRTVTGRRDSSGADPRIRAGGAPRIAFRASRAGNLLCGRRTRRSFRGPQGYSRGGPRRVPVHPKAGELRACLRLDRQRRALFRASSLRATCAPRLAARAVFVAFGSAAVLAGAVSVRSATAIILVLLWAVITALTTSISLVGPDCKAILPIEGQEAIRRRCAR